MALLSAISSRFVCNQIIITFILIALFLISLFCLKEFINLQPIEKECSTLRAIGSKKNVVKNVILIT